MILVGQTLRRGTQQFAGLFVNTTFLSRSKQQKVKLAIVWYNYQFPRRYPIRKSIRTAISRECYWNSDACAVTKHSLTPQTRLSVNFEGYRLPILQQSEIRMSYSPCLWTKCEIRM